MRGNLLAVMFAVLGAVLLLVGGLLVMESWPESSVTSGDCESAVDCPPMTIESGSAAWTLVGVVLGLVGLVALAVALWSAAQRRESSQSH
ncbi:hypothetical protein [Nocardioides antri]|uniref:Uncharacterized protein n=1 Tax=Nocardioides antri TaxID=2607659 RepID=A0A5B1LWQ6_9ACTN|nr:hypothetical protein [Nocardioides antri]KAA1424027.1 hypothetical protein F0U47_20075 [Nocardioides antri]